MRLCRWIAVGTCVLILGVWTAAGAVADGDSPAPSAPAAAAPALGPNIIWLLPLHRPSVIHLYAPPVSSPAAAVPSPSSADLFTNRTAARAVVGPVALQGPATGLSSELPAVSAPTVSVPAESVPTESECTSYSGGPCATLCNDGEWSSSNGEDACSGHGGEAP